MKKFLFLFIIIFLFTFLNADEYATSDSGKKVLLKDDGTWEFIEEIKKAKKLNIQSWRWVNDEYANWIQIEGIVENNTDQTFTNVSIIISAEDADGNYLGNGDSFLEPDTINPGGTSNFSVLIFNAQCTTNSLSISFQFDSR
jgi:hypothetical protein